jgi:hypothetical protein
MIELPFQSGIPHSFDGMVFATVGTGGGELNLFQGKALYVVEQYRGFWFLKY